MPRVSRHRAHVAASVAIRLALGAHPLAFIATFGWAYGKHAFDVAAAAINWASYLNLFLLSGFALVPPAVARLCAGVASPNADRALVRDHLALNRWLIATALVAGVALWASVDNVFPGMAAAGEPLALWFLLFAVLAISQLSLTLWLGVLQAAERYSAALLSVAVPRALALVSLLASAHVGAGATFAITAAVGIVIAGQVALIRAARRVLRQVDSHALEMRGRAGGVLRANISAGSIALVGTAVTIVPVTIVGRLWPIDVGLAHVAVSVSNAVGALFVAAFFPASLVLAQRVHERGEIRRHSLRIAWRVGAATAAAVALAWTTFPLCTELAGQCSVAVYALISLVLIGAGLRLAALGPYHGALAVGRPHLALPSAVAEALVVFATMSALAPGWGLQALGAAFVAGGALRAAVSLGIEARCMP